MKNYWLDIINISAMFWGEGGYLIPFLLSIVLILFWLKNKDAKNMFGLYSILLLVLIYNPLFFIVSGLWLSGSIVTYKNYITEGSVNYVRAFYALPVTFSIAFVFVETVCQLKKVWKKILMVSVCITIFAVKGQNVYSSGNYVKADNWYKVPEETITVCEIIKQTAESDEKIKALVTNDLIVYIRQYEAGITMPYGREMMIQEVPIAFSNGTITRDILDVWLDEIKCNYIVCNWYLDMVGMLLDTGYTIVGETEEHVVLKK